MSLCGLSQINVKNHILKLEIFRSAPILKKLMDALSCTLASVGLIVTQLEFPFILYSSMVLAGAVSAPVFLCLKFGDDL